ncbi:MAG: MATE family efflux transporter [Blautia sp.]|nr:MATE family efflux transporter [Blautia sp.]
MENRQEDNKLGTMPVGKLLLSMALPMMMSFFIQALYNIVDSIFVARISENALTAVSLAFPMQSVMNAIAVGTGVGMSALIPRAIGRKDRDAADDVANTGIFLNLLYVVVFVILGIVLVRPFYQMQTDIAEIVEGGITYLRIVWILGFGVFFGVYFEKMLTSTGFATLAMASQASGAVFNIIFDPLLIFGLGPFPRMGIAGAATATVMGQILASFVAFFLNVRRNSWIRLSVGRVFRPSGRAAKEIYRIGIPSMVTIGLNSVTSFLVNQVLLGYSTTATAVYGIWLKLQNFCFMPAFGMNNGMVPILSYNYGTRAIGRVRATIRYALTSIMSLMLVLTVVLEMIPGVLLVLFDASENMMQIGMVALRILILSLVFGGANIIIGSAMQALNHASYTLLMNIFRNFVMPAGGVFLLSLLFGKLDIVWAAIPIGEVLTFLLGVFLYRKMTGHLKKMDRE